jgi:hypothetical protein
MQLTNGQLTAEIPPEHLTVTPEDGALVAALDGTTFVFTPVAPLASAKFSASFEGAALFSGRNLHSRMPLDPTHVRLKRTCV